MVTLDHYNHHVHGKWYPTGQTKITIENHRFHWEDCRRLPEGMNWMITG